MDSRFRGNDKLALRQPSVGAEGSGFEIVTKEHVSWQTRYAWGFVGANVNSTWAFPRSHFPGFYWPARTFEFTAVCTTRPESAEEALQAFGAKLAFHDFREMAASPEIDAVAVVVRVPSHYEPTKAAIEAGKHVFTEWPLGRNTAEAEELATLARDKGVQTAVGLQSRVQSGIAVRQGTDRSRLCGRGAIMSRDYHAGRQAGTPFERHLAARCQPGAQTP